MTYNRPERQRYYKLDNGTRRSAYSIDIVNNRLFVQTITDVKKTAEEALHLAQMSVIFFLGVLILFFILSGRRQRQGKRLRGGELVSATVLTKHIKGLDSASDLMVAGVPLIKHSECEHMIFLGSPGVGKTQGIYELLDRIRKRKQRAIIYDCEGVFVERYYREGIDKILNPLDARSETWHVWADAWVPMHFDSLAASMMPTPIQQNDPFWLSAARIIFSVAAQRMAGSCHRTSALLRRLIQSNIEELKELAKGTEAEPFISDNLSKLTTSIQAMISSNLASWKYLPDTENAFSIRQWINEVDTKNSEDSWLFITTREDYHETLKPLITTWLDIAGNALLSLNENLSRRIWYVVDELPTLNRIKSFEQLLARGRKRGVCVLAGLQNLAQLQESCGARAPEKLSNLFATSVLYRANDAQTAKWISSALGRHEMEEARESMSYGAHEMRDGVSVNKQVHLRDLVLAEEIMRLPKFEAYLRLAGDFPLAKLQFKFKKRPAHAKAFVARALDDLPLLNLKSLPKRDDINEENVDPSPSLKPRKHSPSLSDLNLVD